MLHPDNAAVVAATAEAVTENAVAITRAFYPRMFAAQPELLDVFNQANQAVGDQPVALASSIVAYARHLLGADDVPFERVISRIAHKHVALGIAPGDYTIVGRHLMAAIGEVLGDAVTPEVARAWDEVYWLFAMDLVAAEARLYGSLGVTPQTLLRDMRVAQVRQETPTVRTLRLEPVDGRPVPDFVPGQYVSVVAQLPDGHRQPRQYTITSAPDPGHLEITVKRVDGVGGAPDGVVSHLLHAAQVGDVWQVSPPVGDIDVAAPGQDRPLVMVSAGIGITPMAGVVAAARAAGSTRRLVHVHGDTSPADHPLREVFTGIEGADFYEAGADADPVTELAQREGSSRPRPGRTGLVDLSTVDLPGDAVYYLCGSVPFMREVRAQALDAGAAPQDIHYEVFGPDLWLGGSAASRAQVG